MTSPERDYASGLHPIAAGEISLIDRTEEMTLLKEAVDRTLQGKGGLVFLYGEAGIGKTRLARELRAYARLHGMQVLRGRCSRLFKIDAVQPYVLWREVIRDYLDNSSMEQLYRVIGFYPAEVAKLVPEVSQKLRAIPQSFPISAEQEQNRLFEAVSQFITNISREAPLLVILDDLQSADPSSLLLLHYLANGVHKAPLLLLGAYRSTDVDAKHPLTPILEELNRELPSQSAFLKRMSPADVSEMIKQILDESDVPTTFCNTVYERTRGNPFFAEEVIKSLKEEEVIYKEKNKWKIKEISRIEFPETVKSLVRTRINRLDDESQSVLTLASFFGNDFTLETMSAAMGIEEDKLLELMDRILKTGLIREKEIHGEKICSFADILVRDIVYEEVGLLKRKKLHGIVGSTLEKAYVAKIDEHLGELAHHFLEAGDKEKALQYFLNAGERATKVYANSEAASYFQYALQLLESKQGELRRAEVLERIGDIKSTVGEYNEAINSWNQASLLWEQLGEKEKDSGLLRKMSNVLWHDLGETEKAKQDQEKALAILEGEPMSVELARLYSDMSRLQWHTGNMNGARSSAEKALDLAEKMNAPEVIAEACNNLAMVLYSTGEAKRSIQCLEKALKIALNNSYIESALRAYNNLANALWSEQIEKSLDLREKGFELARKVGHTFWISWLGSTLAGLYINMGNMGQALDLAEQSVALNKRTHNQGNLAASLGNLGQVYMVLGEWEKSEQCLNEALAISKKQNRFQEIARSYANLGAFFLYAKEEPAKAEEFYDKAREVCEKAGAKSHKMSFSEGLIASYIELGEFDKASNLLDDLQRYALELDDRGFISDVHILRARLSRAQERWEESIKYFDLGLKEWDALTYKQQNVQNYVRDGLWEYARVFLERDQEGDREKACNLLNQALEMFRKMGDKKDVEKTQRLINGLQLAPPVQTLVIPHGHPSDEVYCNITASPTEVKVGENLELEIEITNNLEEGIIQLIRLIEVVPNGFALAKKPELHRVEGSSLNLKRKRLEPSRTEEVKLELMPKVQGTFHIEPKIVYLDKNGKEKTTELRPVSITVKELGLKGWLKGQA